MRQALLVPHALPRGLRVTRLYVSFALELVAARAAGFLIPAGAIAELLIIVGWWRSGRKKY